MKCIILLIFSITLISAFDEQEFEPYRARWLKFKKDNHKTYNSTEEEDMRKTIFMENVKEIDAHNAKYKAGEVKYQLGINKFADMTNEEYIKLVSVDLNFADDPTTIQRYSISNLCTGANNENLCSTVPDSVNWTQCGAVNPVRDQGQCGACWAFSVIAAIEAQHFLRTGVLVQLSEQYLIDCAYGNGTRGCSGGVNVRALEWASNAGIVVYSDLYPYEERNSTCRFNPQMTGVSLKTFGIVEPFNEEALKIAVANIGPVIVSVDPMRMTFQRYTGGIYDDPDCSKTNLSHAVVAVGYGTENGTDYWLLKNQWGVNWGIRGYMKMIRGKNMCGLSNRPCFPIDYN